MINHSTCDHESTSSARAKCRRARANGKVHTSASTKQIDMRDGTPTGKAQTPRDRDKQCDNCGVEKIEYRGTDLLTQRLLYVGERCRYMIKRAPDFMVLPD
jgi:DNA-directed RNA polymerase subunit M/transcription elongation factor TFIIS